METGSPELHVNAKAERSASVTGPVRPLLNDSEGIAIRIGRPNALAAARSLDIVFDFEIDA